MGIFILQLQAPYHPSNLNSLPVFLPLYPMVCDLIWPRVSTFLKSVEKDWNKKSLVLAISGGPDSIVLLHLLKTYTPKYFPGLSLHIAHLNHSLRGIESDEDAKFVDDLSIQWKIPSTIEKIDVKKEAEARKQNLEAMARELRYDFLRRVALSLRVDTIATGHTITDQAETVLLRLLRGSSLDGLASIHSIRNLDSSLRIIRPLINISRKEIEDYLARHCLIARHDTTNNDIEFTRNKLRKQIWPLLTDISPNIERVLARTAEQAQDNKQYFEEIVTEWLTNYKKDTNEEISIPIEELNNLSKTLQARIIHRIIQNPNFPAVSNYHVQKVREILLKKGSNGKMINLPGNRIALRRENYLLIKSSTIEPEVTQLKN